MKRDLSNLGPTIPDLVENGRREVESSGGGCHGASLGRVGIDRLVHLSILVLIGAVNVGRQRYVSEFLEARLEIRHRVEPDRPLAKLASFQDLGFEVGGAFSEREALADANLAPRADQRFPFERLFEAFGQQKLATAVQEVLHSRIVRAERLRSTSAAVSEQARWDDPSVVQDQQVRGAEQCRKLPECKVLKGARVSMQVKHASGGPVGGGTLRNQLLGKMEIELGYQHGTIIKAASFITPLDIDTSNVRGPVDAM